MHRKIPTFGSVEVNLNVMRGNTPMEFTNGAEYEKKRNFFTQNMKVLKCEKKEILNVVVEEFQQFANNIQTTHCVQITTSRDFEDGVGEMICNISSRLMLGCLLDYKQVQQ